MNCGCREPRDAFPQFSGDVTGEMIERFVNFTYWFERRTMRVNRSAVSKLLSELAESFGEDSVEPFESLSETRIKLLSYLDAQSNSPLSGWMDESHEILAMLLPQKAAVFLGSNRPREPCDVESETISTEVGILMLIRAVMRGLVLFDSNEHRKLGAEKVLDTCPNPIPPPKTPFADRRGVWRHTHVDSDDVGAN